MSITSVAKRGVTRSLSFYGDSVFFLCMVSSRGLNFNPRQAICTQQQRKFPGMGQVVVEEPPDRLHDRYLLLGKSIGG